MFDIYPIDNLAAEFARALKAEGRKMRRRRDRIEVENNDHTDWVPLRECILMTLEQRAFDVWESLTKDE